MINILFMILYVILTVSGLILFKHGSIYTNIGIITNGILNLQLSFSSIIGILCYLSSFFVYLLLISKNTITFLMPVMTGIVYISVLTASVLILKEKITLISVLGSFFILFGIMLMIFKGK